MKYYNRILLLAMVAGITVSCADALFADYKTEKPESLKKYEYLNEYGDLKTYIDRISHPDFKLGTGVTVSDFLKQDLVYTLTVNNYDDVTAGNAMKYSSCVDAKGNMDFGTVKKFVKTAKETGISISELARRLGQTPQNFNKKLQRETVTTNELMDIGNVLGVRFEQSYTLETGEKLAITNESK